MTIATVLEPIEAKPFDEEVLFEIIDGTWVEILPMGAFASLLANDLAAQLNAYARPNNLGRTVVEVLFHLALSEDRNRRPDVAFVSFERWSKNRAVDPTVKAWDVVPNIAAEIVSPSDLIEDLMIKIDEYFRSGVQLVWVVYPQQNLIYVYDSWTSVRILTREDVLDGGSVLPQFQLPLKDLFPEE